VIESVRAHWKMRHASDISGVPAEFLRLHFRHWRTSLVGAALAGWVTAAAFASFAPSLWLAAWTAVGTLIYALEAVLCLRLERQTDSVNIPCDWHDAITALSFAVGLTWGSLPWCLPSSNRDIQLAVALVCCFVITGAATASGSRAVLVAVVGTTSLLLALGMALHAGQPRIALLTLVMNGVTLRYGWVLQRAMVHVLEERHRAEGLWHQLSAQETAMQAIATERAVLEERNRLMRDMHDGIGSSMISALKMFEHGRISLEEAAGVMQECVDELRLVIDSLEPLEGDLGALLGTMRRRMESRLERVGVSMHWSVEDLPPLPWMAASQALEVLRILQEMLANVIQHAGATSVRVCTRATESAHPGAGIEVRVEDDGVGFEPGRVGRGRGLRHMEDRARRLGGAVSVDSAPGRGTRLLLCLPFQLAGVLVDCTHRTSVESTAGVHST
jgi:signal transduction histidine kinase